MTRERAKELLPIIKAFAEGKEVQIFYDNKWNDLEKILYTEDSDRKYRIKPSKKYVPFTFEDYELFMGKEVVYKHMKRYAIVTGCSTEELVYGFNTIKYLDSFDILSFADGTPFGKEVEE